MKFFWRNQKNKVAVYKRCLKKISLNKYLILVLNFYKMFHEFIDWVNVKLA